jgi:hypothetical protein
VANEITFSVSLTCFKPAVMPVALAQAIGPKTYNMTGNFTVGPASISIATSATVIPLGQITAMGWCWFYNNDPINYVEIMNGPAGTDRMRFYPTWGTWVPLMPGWVPYGIANTAAVALTYALLSF